MPRTSTRTSFHSSSLIRVLADLALVEGGEQGIAFAENLALWLNLDDAIALRALHAADTSTTLTGSRSAEKLTLADEFTRLQASLMKLDLPAELISRTRSRTDERQSAGDLPIEIAATYEPYRRQYISHQRSMDSNIGTFRAKVREVLARTSPRLAKLAALDAIFDKSLAEREKKLLSMIPSLLEARFKHLQQSHQQSMTSTKDTEGFTPTIQSGAWLARFRQELQAVLLAELDARLEPTLGLVEAYHLEITQSP